MSSILDALKKLEKKASQQDYPLPHARVDRKVFTPKRTIWTIGSACLCIGAILFVVFYRSIPGKVHEPLVGDATPAPKLGTTLDDQKTSLTSAHKTPSPLPSTSLNHNLTDAARKPETIISSDKTGTKPRSLEDRSNTDEATAKNVQVVELKKPQREKQLVDKAFQEPERQIPIEEKDKPDPEDDLSTKTFTQEKKPLPIDRLEGVGFKIQAIAWNEIPEKRLVVIKNQVLREGNDIQGYQISRINPDDIVLRRGDKEYQLDLALRGWP